MKTLSDIYERTVSAVQRKKQARRMSKMAKSSAFQFKKKKAMLRMRNPAKLMQIARKKAVQSFRDKFYPSYKEMSVQQRVKVDQLLMQKYGGKIDKISRKLAVKLKGAEGERIARAKEALKVEK